MQERCKCFRHFEKTCKLAEPLDEDAMASQSTPRKRRLVNVDATAASSSAPNEKKRTPKKKKTPHKRRNLVSCSAPPARVATRLSDLLGLAQPTNKMHMLITVYNIMAKTTHFVI
ncbi:uncharacterized protein LOC127764977 [Oryza glaberrima]|uniref:uncharacterized protein LOC127764977 n=1 Tax=Oryza glaberrima TaxID=4538 RepID=UPI00224BE8B6|nr:uncharacterized protein LOC127764977 [Oryza glaberrima]